MSAFKNKVLPFTGALIKPVQPEEDVKLADEDESEIDQEEADQNDAVEYALCVDGNFNQVYINMEIMISCEKLPKLKKEPPNTMAVLYMDEAILNVANDEGPKPEAASPHLAGFTPAPVRQEYQTNWVEKFRTELIHGEENPIYIKSHQFKSTRYDLITIRVEIYHVPGDPRHMNERKATKNMQYIGYREFKMSELMKTKYSSL